MAVEIARGHGLMRGHEADFGPGFHSAVAPRQLDWSNLAFNRPATPAPPSGWSPLTRHESLPASFSAENNLESDFVASLAEQIAQSMLEEDLSLPSLDSVSDKSGHSSTANSPVESPGLHAFQVAEKHFETRQLGPILTRAEEWGGRFADQGLDNLSPSLSGQADSSRLTRWKSLDPDTLRSLSPPPQDWSWEGNGRVLKQSFAPVSPEQLPMQHFSGRMPQKAGLPGFRGQERSSQPLSPNARPLPRSPHANRGKLEEGRLPYSPQSRFNHRERATGGTWAAQRQQNAGIRMRAGPGGHLARGPRGSEGGPGQQQWTGSAPTTPVAGNGSGFRAVFLGGPNTQGREGSGTGVFLPRSAGAAITTKSKTACSTVLLPSRLVQVLNLSVNDAAVCRRPVAGGQPFHKQQFMEFNMQGAKGSPGTPPVSPPKFAAVSSEEIWGQICSAAARNEATARMTAPAPATPGRAMSLDSSGLPEEWMY